MDLSSIYVTGVIHFQSSQVPATQIALLPRPQADKYSRVSSRNIKTSQ